MNYGHNTLGVFKSQQLQTNRDYKGYEIIFLFLSYGRGVVFIRLDIKPDLLGGIMTLSAISFPDYHPVDTIMFYLSDK